MPHEGIKPRALAKNELVDLMMSTIIPMADDPSPPEDLFNWSIPEWKKGNQNTLLPPVDQTLGASL
jgi:hypothetical protein